MRHFRLSLLTAALCCFGLLSCTKDFSVSENGEALTLKGTYTDFRLRGEFLTEEGDAATVRFHCSDTGPGYEVIFRNGAIDGTLKSGSLAHVRNLYRSLARDGQWCRFEIAVFGKNVSVCINGTQVVNYTEPDRPFRNAEGMLLGSGAIRFAGLEGTVKFRKVEVCGTARCRTALADVKVSEPVDESTDRIIRLQQEDFPVIDYHLHLKGGLTEDMARSMSLSYGINYGIAPNAGEGGVGQMLGSDSEVYEYFDSVRDLPFLRGVQGEGRRWTAVFSKEALGTFDYLFTDAMTIVDHKGRITRLYHPEEVIPDGLGRQEYMDLIVDQTVKILSNEPADIYANATFLPDFLAEDYDRLWTDERTDKVLDVLKAKGIALEINARYRIPGERIILRAKEKGVKFTFGTNNADADTGKLEYCLDMVEKCGLSKEDIWFPSQSTRAGRETVIYNVFSEEGRRISLFNGENLDGWVRVADTTVIPENLFSVKDGVIAIEGQPFGYLRTAKKYADYKLSLEYRWIGEGTNSGIFQRVDDSDKVWPLAIECQLKAGCAGDLVCLGGARLKEIPYNPEVKFPVKTRNHPGASVELPDGQWNRVEITCKGTKMLVYVNGSLENRATLPATEGYIALQSEGGPLEFRNIVIEPVE
ncbi:MAG: DUF1080 domain-containing protein [Bacteroidales bacterium]|nr:DUF1080 domain-containing protein [Bacteroidales bacterium]